MRRKKGYSAPVLYVFGSMDTSTGANFLNTSDDGIYFWENQVGTAQGSMDACVFGEGPPPPDAACL